MGVRLNIKFAVGLTLVTCIPSWAAVSERPPENYKGPIAERPMIQRGDYWIYQRADLTRIKSARLYPPT